MATAATDIGVGGVTSLQTPKHLLILTINNHVPLLPFMPFKVKTPQATAIVDICQFVNGTIKTTCSLQFFPWLPPILALASFVAPPIM